MKATAAALVVSIAVVAALLLSPDASAAADGVSIASPPPGARGVYHERTLTPDGTVEGEFPFRSEADVRVLDGAGNEILADHVEWLRGTSQGMASYGLPGPVGDLTTSEVRRNITVYAWFHPGSRVPVASLSHAGVDMGFSRGAFPESSSFDVVTYDPEQRPLCRLRNALQGREILDGARLPEEEFCEVRQHGGAPVEWAARTEAGALVLETTYLWNSTYVRTEGGVTRSHRSILEAHAAYRFVDGFPFPVSWNYESVCVVRVDHGLCAGGHETYRRLADLTRYDPGAMPARPPAEPATARPSTDLAPVTRWGPADGAGLSWPLSEAVATARSDPRLPGTAAWLRAHPDAVLARAEHRTADGGTGTEWWSLGFSDRSGDGWRVQLERVAAAGSLPAAVVREGEEGGLPAFGTDDLPARAPSLADARAEWARSYGSEHGEPTSLVWSVQGGGLAPALGDPYVGAGRLPDREGSAAVPQGRAAALLLLLGADGLRYAVVEEHVQRGFATDLPIFDAQGPSPDAAGDRRADALRAGASTWPAVAIGGVSALTLLLLVFLEPARAAVWRFLFVPMFSRLERGAILDNDARRRLVEAARADPGLHASGLLDRAGVSGGVGEYHLAVLEREGYLALVRHGGYRRYFVAGSLDRRAMERVAALRAGSNARVLDAVRAEPGVRLTDLARAVGLSVAACSKAVRQLEAAGLVEKVRRGREIQLLAPPAPDTVGGR